MEIFKSIEQVLNHINGIVWGPPLLILLVGTGVYFTFKLKLLQIFKLPLAIYFQKMMKSMMKMQREMYQVLRHFALLYQQL